MSVSAPTTQQAGGPAAQPTPLQVQLLDPADNASGASKAVRLAVRSLQHPSPPTPDSAAVAPQWHAMRLHKSHRDLLSSLQCPLAAAALLLRHRADRRAPPHASVPIIGELAVVRGGDCSGREEPSFAVAEVDVEARCMLSGRGRR